MANKTAYYIAYIITSDKKLLRKNLDFEFFPSGENFCCVKTKKALIAYCQFKACDWVNIITGPQYFYHVSELCYSKMLDLINDGKYVTYAKIYNETYWFKGRLKRFTDAVQHIGGIISVREEL